MNIIKDFHSVKERLTDYFDNHDCHYVYISLGSKFNEQNVDFTYPKVNKHSNALNQMIPSFTYPYSCEKNTLFIIIDDFHDNESLLKNQHKLEHMTMDLPYMKIFLVDYLVNIQNIDLLITSLMDSIHPKINPDQFMLCNFIRFKSPNDHDNQLETQLPIKIHHFLKNYQNGCYSKKFYQWYGYSYYTYHYVYNYESYRHGYMLHIRPIFHMLEKVLKDCLDDFNIDLVDLYIQKHKQSADRWTQFKQHSICIV